MIGAVRAYEQLCERNKDYKQADDLFPQHHRDGLNQQWKSQLESSKT